MSKNIIRKVMLILLLMSILNTVFAFDLVEADQSRDGEAGTVMSPSTLDEGMLRENSKHPSILELRDEKNDPSDFCTPFDCSLSSNPPSFNFINVSVADAKGMIESIEYLVLVDVRNSEEYFNGHIGNAVHIPLSQCELRSRELSTRKALVVYCRCGIRSIKACRIFAENGFENVYNMLGGIEAWSNAGYPLTVSIGYHGILSSYDKLGESTPSSLYPGATSVDDEATSINDINNAIASAGANWIAGKTQVSRLAFDERKLRCGAILQAIEGAERLSKPVGVIPIGTFDWRNVNETDWMTPVKDQGACGSCWAFGTLGSMEAVINIVSQNPTMDVDLSEQFLVSCCDECGDCGGGWPDTTYDFIMDTGVPTESCFPYVASNVPCAPCQWWEDEAYKITSWFQVSNDADSIKWALQSYGPLGVGMYAPDDFLYYKSGVYEPVWSSPEWEEEFSYSGGNHWVTLVGYNDSEGYWIVKNSWGANWGEEGYGKIAFGVLENHDYILAIQSAEIPVPQEHDLAVTLQVPKYVSPGTTSLLNATVRNLGLNNETNVELFLLIDDAMVSNVTIPALNNGTSYTINNLWTPMVEGLYNVTAYAPPVADENVTMNNVVSVLVSVKELDVALFKNVDPWGYSANEESLSLYGIDYAVFSSSDFGIVDLSSFSKVIIVSDQDQTFYNAVDAYRWWFENYVYSGGVLEIHAADWGWNGGHWVSTLPGELTLYNYYADYVTIVDPAHLVVTVPNEITDSELDEWHCSVHGYFSFYPIDSNVVIVEDSTGYPSYLEVYYGTGAIIATSQTLEWSYARGYSLILENSLLYTPIKYPHELGVALETPTFLEPNASSLLRATVYNRGLNNETNVELQIIINSVVVSNITIPNLVNGTSYILNYSWTPSIEATYNVTAYAPPVPDENVTLNNINTRFVSVQYPLIKPVEGQYANYVQNYYGPSGNVTEPWNFTYDHYVQPYKINITLRLKDPSGHIFTGWLIVNTMNRFVESGVWANLWYLGWIETDIDIGSTINLLSGNATVNGSKIIVVGGRVIDCWEIPYSEYGYLYTFWYDKKSGLWIGMESTDYYGNNVEFLLVDTNIPIGTIYEHDLGVTLEAPVFLELGSSALLNITVYNWGLSDETNVEFWLLIDDIIVNKVTMPLLKKGTSLPIDWLWTPTVEAIYNITAYIPPVAGENVTANNVATKMVYVRPIIGHVVFEEAHLPAYTIGSNPAAYVTGGYSEFANYLTINGYMVSTIDPGTVIDPSVLASVDVLVIVAPQNSYSAYELDAIENWVKSGGNLLLISDWGNFGLQARVIAARFNTNLRGDCICDSDDNAGYPYWPYYDGANLLLHPVTADVSRIEMYAGDGITSALTDEIPLIVTDSDGTAYWRSDDSPALGIPVMNAFDGGTTGSGRLIIMTDCNIWDSAYDTDGDGDVNFYDTDNEILALNSINWFLIRYEHELTVSLECPQRLQPGETSLLNATVYNVGLNNETDVEIQLLINGTKVANETLTILANNTCHTLNYSWTPTMDGTYNVTAYVPPVPGENVTMNNVASSIVRVQVFPDILVVNDDDGGAFVYGTSLLEFELALMVGGYDYWVWNESSMGNPSLDFLTEFQLVIWTCGDYWDWAVDSADAVTLQAYLAQGGNILVEGEDIGYDHGADSFMANVAHAIYEVDGTGASGLTVSDQSHPVTAGLPNSFTWQTYPPYDDGVSPTNGGAEVIQYTGTTWTAVTVFEGASNGSVVYYAFPLYCLAESHKETLAINSINWLLGIRYEHELVVRLDAPDSLMPSDSWLLSATVCNRGLNNETDVKLFLMINDTVVNNATIHKLVNGICSTINYLWTPLVEAVYNVTAYAPPVSGENVTTNNVITRLVHVRSLQSNQPVVYVNPHVVTAVTGETFTVAVNLFNVTEPFSNLYGFDIKFAWNPAIIKYVSHTITVPVEQYPDGVLHEPILPIMETVESDHVWFAYASLGPAEPFNNPNASNSIFLITFKVVGEGTSELRFTKLSLANVDAEPIVHSCIDGLVIAAPPTGHDVAVINVSSCADTVCTGTTVNITVLAANEGIATETFNITLYANSTVIGVQTITLYRGENATLTFSWNTTGLAPCSNFTILAKASLVPFETNVVNNICFNGWIRIKMLGDLNGDDIIDIYDIILAGNAYDSQPGDPNWNPEADVAKPYGHIDIFDIVTIASKYGQTP